MSQYTIAGQNQGHRWPAGVSAINREFGKSVDWLLTGEEKK
jgi:hypothetical protein